MDPEAEFSSFHVKLHRAHQFSWSLDTKLKSGIKKKAWKKEVKSKYDNVVLDKIYCMSRSSRT